MNFFATKMDIDGRQLRLIASSRTGLIPPTCGIAMSAIVYRCVGSSDI
jgi:hypothetical protein